MVGRLSLPDSPCWPPPEEFTRAAAETEEQAEQELQRFAAVSEWREGRQPADATLLIDAVAADGRSALRQSGKPVRTARWKENAQEAKEWVVLAGDFKAD